ncbi:AcrR family transcriptional regulator [Caldicoprobacter guelmensis]|uniref:TetR/AcrR family transcriptional regulator n=1 Tax=Caldicoprobacter guelmensis TaxID=1170224 RepID=UPI00195D8B48|nr:TetR/AcrR family transcriptional regulator [Caldicoprobacter guelmensis]MBM7581953.1 AcrR family transcriptional regulator [Caldicoprobacter guelmensis]
MEGKMDTQDKIIATAIDMVGRQINLDFTVREIAEKANVNLASVNYYFRSKYNLLNEVEKYFVRQSHHIYEEVARLNAGPKEKIKFWAMKTMEHIMEYPGIIYLIVTKLLHNRGKNAGIVDLIDTLEHNIMPLVKELTGVVDDFTASVKLMQLFSGVVAPVLFYYGAGRTFNIDMRSSKDREAYVESLIESIL